MNKASPRPFNVSSRHALAYLKNCKVVVACSDDNKFSDDSSITVVQVDSREIGKGEIFLAYKGLSRNSHDYVKAVIENLPALLVVEDETCIPSDCNIPWIKVRNGREAWSYLAALLNGEPQKKLKFLGVTGTNGKTSTVWYTKELLASMGYPCIAIGTLGIFMGDEFFPSAHTTPDPPAFFQSLAVAVEKNIEYCVMEVSSHAIEQKKLEPIKFDACAFTSFSRDHLDLHGTMENYFEAKMRLFSDLAKPDARRIFCDKVFEFRSDLGTFPKQDCWVYGSRAKKVAASSGIPRYLQLEYLSRTLGGIDFEILAAEGPRRKGFVPIVGDHALENFSCAMLLVEKLSGNPLDPELWTSFSPVPGRLEAVYADTAGAYPFVAVDYAHTPDAISKSLAVLKNLCKGDLWIVFGCGGDRDKGKRPLMAAAAEEVADKIVITTDNPRTEKPEQILAEIVSGITIRSKLALTELDREKAITYAITHAKSEDTVLIAGKGHEDYMVVGTKKIYFDDRVVAKKVLQSL
jgi:UDP-N-acetylmuramoyl-L-alanyl-D-glutamate--2,6-diaminopimelate ligase